MEVDTRKQVLDYCDRDLAADERVSAMFDFIIDPKMKERIEAEFYAARYIYKLGEALAVSDEKLHAHVKFQIVQYAGIYEAIIVKLLWTTFAERPEVTEMEFHAVMRTAVSMPSSLQITTTQGEDIHFCVERKERTSPISIKFDDKVNAAVAIGFVDAEIGEEIKSFYKLRNALHLESAIKNDIKYEIASSQLAFRRMLPFTRGVREFLATGTLPDSARKKATATQSS